MNAHQNGDRPINLSARPWSPLQQSQSREEGPMNAQVLPVQPTVVPLASVNAAWRTPPQIAMPPAGAAPGPRRLDSALLVLGAGGAGLEASTHVKALMMDPAGHLPANMAVRAYDSADEQYAVADPRFVQPVMLEPGVERKYIGRVPVARIRLAPDRHGEMLARLGPAGLKSIRRSTIDGGAGQNRQEGLAALLWSYGSIKADLTTTVHTLMRRDQTLEADGIGAHGFTGLLFASLCGGQGSGAALDLALSLRQQIERLGLGDNSRIIAFLFTPDAFPEARGPNMAANTHAALLEWDALMQGHPFEAVYPGGVRVRSTGLIVDQIIVLGGVDENGRTLGSREEAISLAAKAAAVMVSSDVGLREQFNVINETGVLDGISPDGHQTCLATVGQAAIAFAAEQTAEWCAVCHATALVRHVLTASGRARELTLAAASGLAERIAISQSGAPLTVDFAAPTTLLSAPVEDAPAMARTLVSNGLKHRVFETGYAQLAQNGAAASETLRAEVQDLTATVTASGRLGAGVADLKRLEEHLATQAAAATTEAERLATLAEDAQASLEAASTAMNTAADSNVFVRRGQVRTAVVVYLSQATVLANARLAQRAAYLAATALAAALGQARREVAAAQDAVARLGAAAARLDERLAELAHGAVSHSEIDLATPELRQQFYDQHAGDVAALAGVAADELGPAATWGSLTAETLARRLTAVAGRVFAPVAQLTVEQVLLLNWNDRSAGHWIARLSELAAGAWNLDRALLPGGGDNLARFLTIGVPDASQSIFANAGLTLVSTHDPERIVALRTVYGASFEALQAAPQWREAYEAVPDRARLHVLPGFQSA